MKNILFAVLAVIIFGSISHYEHNYTRESCEVIQINDGWATIEDKNGFLWEYDSNGLEIGDIVDLEMHDQHTTDITDDIIKNIVK